MKTLADTFGIDNVENLPVKVEKSVEQEIIVPNTTLSDQESDYKLSRKTFKSLIAKGTDAVDELFELAKSSEHPRSYEVLATLMKTVSDTTKDLYDLQKKTKELKQSDNRPPEGTHTNIEKAVFVGTTADLIKQIQNDPDV